MSLNRYIYRIIGLDLLPGNKSAGFVLSVDALALQQLSHLSVTAQEQLAVIDSAQTRASRAGLGNRILRSGMGIAFHKLTPVPRVFSALSGSIGADPELWGRMQAPDFVQCLPQGVEYTPHNTDSPAEAMLLMLLAQTWGEWATDLLLFNQDKLETMTPVLKPIPTYGDLMSLEDFQACQRSGAIIPDDGQGVYATAAGVSELDCFEPAPSWATHVMWFNR